jgi:hypothetical protein
LFSSRTSKTENRLSGGKPDIICAACDTRSPLYDLLYVGASRPEQVVADIRRIDRSRCFCAERPTSSYLVFLNAFTWVDLRESAADNVEGLRRLVAGIIDRAPNELISSSRSRRPATWNGW